MSPGENMQQIVTKRIEAEIGNLFVQLTIKNVEIDQLKAENAELKMQLTGACPESGQHKENSNGN